MSLTSPEMEPTELGAVLKVQRHHPDAALPVRAHPDDAGLDLTAVGVSLLRAGMFSFDTGISIQFSTGFYGEIAPRSSIVKSDFMMANSIGVIDPGYRGKLRILLRYFGEGSGLLQAEALVGNRIGQLLVRRIESCRVVAVTALESSARGEGGFGSTGQ